VFAIEILSALLNVGFVLGLAFRVRWAWVLGFFGSTLAVILLFDSKLYAESLLNLSYALLAVYGWFSWGRPASALGPIISRPIALVLMLGLAVGLAWLMITHTDNPRPLADAIMFSGGILGTLWQVQRDRWNWPLWLVLNGIGIWLYADRGLWAYAMYSGLMAGLACWGWFRWGSEVNAAKATSK
jgi:nicotinamide mononucleotide transporter